MSSAPSAVDDSLSMRISDAVCDCLLRNSQSICGKTIALILKSYEIENDSGWEQCEQGLSLRNMLVLARF
jgi:hypothetical protein